MIDPKLYSLIKVAETASFTRAANALNLTQPAVSQHIRQLENSLGVRIFDRTNGALHITREGEVVLKYARRMLSMTESMKRELEDNQHAVSSLTVGITHTAESNAIAETLGRYAQKHEGLTIKMITDTSANLYDMLRSYSIDMAIVEGRANDPAFKYLMLDTDCIVLAVAPEHPLANRASVTIDELKRERMILRLPDSNTRNQFVASLESRNLSIDDFNVILEINNVATIKDLVRQGIGVSVLAKSVCLDELRKHKICTLPIENLTMMREINIVYSEDCETPELLNEIVRYYNSMAFPLK